MTVFISLPIDGDSISTTSPGAKNSSVPLLPSGFVKVRSAAVPADVPPHMMSPGTKVKSRDNISMISAKEKIISAVV